MLKIKKEALKQCAVKDSFYTEGARQSAPPFFVCSVYKLIFIFGVYRNSRKCKKIKSRYV